MKSTIKVETHKGDIYVSYILKKSRWNRGKVYLICFSKQDDVYYTTSNERSPLYSGSRKNLMNKEPLNVIHRIASMEFYKLDPFNLKVSTPQKHQNEIKN